MIKIPFLGKKEKFLGIDVGTFSTRIVCLSYSRQGEVFLDNYGEKFHEIKKDNLYETTAKKTFCLSRQETVDNIKEILIKSKINEKKAMFSIPDFMTFFTTFKIPFMPKEEMDAAIHFESKQHIPLPPQEIFLDWSVIEEGDHRSKQGSKIILVAVPNKVVEEYQNVAKLADIELQAIEAEIFSLVRSSFDELDKDKFIQLIDVGIQSTTISIAKNGIVRSVFSVGFSESQIVKNIAKRFSISYNEVDTFKKEKGFDDTTDKGKEMCNELNFLINEINRVSDNFYRMENKKIDKIIFSGGLTSFMGFKDYIQKNIKKEVSIINPFSNISYPQEIKGVISELSPRYAIAIGLALRNKKIT
jgi:type IV pilus assembly protein PilM